MDENSSKSKGAGISIAVILLAIVIGFGFVIGYRSCFRYIFSAFISNSDRAGRRICQISG